MEKTGEALVTESSPNIIRRLYDWVLSWADSRYGVAALFILSFAESSFFPIPPDILLIALAISARKKAFYFALICSVGSLIGGVFGYVVGWQFWDLTSNFFFTYIPGFSPERFALVQDLYTEHGFMIVFTAGFTFIPYKIFTISSGVFQLNFIGFLIASAFGRAARFFLVAALIWKFGAPIKHFIDKYFNLLAFLFVVLLIGGFILIKYSF